MSAESFIKRSFCMHVAAVCSEEAELCVRQNNLTFCEMLRPFCHLSADVSIRDPQGHFYNAKDIHVRFVEPMTEVQSDSKLRLILDATVHWTESKIKETERRKAYSPWYDFYRDTFLENMSVSNHDLLRHFICTVLVIASDSEDPLSELESLRGKMDVMKHNSNHHRWLPQSVDYCVVLHDASQSDPERGASVLEQVKEKFGKHCTLLSINSVTTDGAAAAGGERSFLDPWSRILQREGHSGGGPSTAVTQPLPPLPPSNTTTLEGSSVPNGPLKPSEARGEAELVNANGSPPPSLAVVEDPLLHLGKTRPPPNTAGFGRFMSSDDHERLRKFVLDLTRQTLVPTLCSIQKTLGELVQARRGGFQKMWKSLRNIASNSPAVPPLYQNDSQEAQTRLLADVSMLLQNYEHAYQLYHSLKGDFKADKAWLNYAGAMELSAVSCFMSSHKLLTSYLDESMTFYLSHADSSHFAFRVLLTHCELLKGQQKYKEAALVYLRMSSAPKGSFLASSDLRCALALEETGNCYLLAGMTRQYCLFVFMAAHRYIKARQMIHGARALNQALGVLRGKDWSLSEVFLQTSLARHYWQCHRYHEACQSFEMVLANADHRQSPTAQHPLFKEYIYALKHLFGSSAQPSLTGRWSTAASVTLTGGLPTLVVPEVLSSRTKVLFSAVETCPKCPVLRTTESVSAISGSTDTFTVGEQDEDSSGGVSLSSLVYAAASKTRDTSRHSITLEGTAVDSLSSADLQRHWKLEEELAKNYSNVQRVPVDFEPCMLHLDATTVNTRRPYCIINEPVCVEVSVKNRLQIPLQLTNVSLIWKLEPEVPGTPVDPENAALGEVVPSVVLYRFDEKQIRLHMVPLKEGVLHITGLVYTLQSHLASPSVPHRGTEASTAVGSLSLASQSDVGGVQGRRDLTICGPRLNRTMVERTSIMYGTDHRLSWTIRPPAPRLKVLMENYPTWLLAGEVCPVAISFTNCGWKALQTVYLATSLPEYFAVVRGASSTTAEGSATPPPPSAYHHFTLPKEGLPPGGHHRGEVLVQAPPRHTQFTWDWLYYYVPTEEIKGMSHRVVPFTARVDVCPSLNVTCAVHNCCVTPDSMGDSVLLTLEVENVYQMDGGRRQATVLSVYQISCISWDGWTITPLDTSQGVLDIYPEQCGHVVLKASQSVDSVKGEGVEELKFCDLTLGEEKVKSDLFPAVNLFKQSQVHRDLCDRSTSDKQRKKSIALAVFWKASISLKEGIRHAHGIHFALLDVCTDRNAPRPQSVAPRICQDRVVQWCLRHPPSVAHDFNKNRALLVPVELILLNTCAIEELSVQISLRSSDTTTAPRHDVPLIQWVGVTEWRVPHLKAKERLTVQRHICITSPDVYPISTLVHVSIVRPSSGRVAQNAPPIFVPQTCAQSAVITVTNLDQ